MKKAIILLGLLVIIGGAFWLSKGAEDNGPVSQEEKYAEPADAADAFYKDWLRAAQDTAAVPNKATLAQSSILAKELGARIAAALNSGGAVDPVLCQSVVPQGITLRNVYEESGEAQVLVTSKDKSVTKQALVELAKSGDTWIISDIQCNDGEFAPAKEFSFEQEGFLIKNSVPKPFNNKVWHLVFTQDGKPGNVVPLIFDAKSQCTNIEGVKSVCKPEQFTEASKVKVYGQMTERGAAVARLEFVK